MRFLAKILFFCFLSSVTIAEESLFKSLASSYLNNPTLNSQREKTKAVDETLVQAYSNFKPTITGTITKEDTLNKNSTDYSNTGISDSNLQTSTQSITITQKLFQGLSNAKKVKKSVEISRYELKDTEQEVLYKTVEAFTEVVLYQKQVLINKDNLDLADKQVELDKARYNKGSIKWSDLAQSESSLASAKSKLLSSQNALANSKNSFKNIVGYFPEKLNINQIIDLNLPKSLNETVLLAEQSNPGLIIADLKAKRAVDELNHYKESAFAPKTSLSYKASEYDEYSSTVDKRFQSEFSAEVSIPIYSGGQGYSLVKEKKALKISSELDYLDKKNEVNKTASLAWSDYQLNQSRLDLAKAQLKAAEIAFEGIEQEYESGQRTTLDVLSSRGLLLEARFNLINSERNEILSRFYILKAIGNLTANFLKLEAKIYNPEEYSKKNWIRHLF